MDDLRCAFGEGTRRGRTFMLDKMDFDEEDWDAQIIATVVSVPPPGPTEILDDMECSALM